MKTTTLCLISLFLFSCGVNAEDSGHHALSSQAKNSVMSGVEPNLISPTADANPFPWGTGFCEADFAPGSLSPYEYMIAVVRALNKLRMGREVFFEKFKPLSKDLSETAQENFLLGTKQATQYYGCAAEILKPFRKSSNEDISGTAQLIAISAEVISMTAIRTKDIALGNLDPTAKKMSLDEKTNNSLAAEKAWKDLGTYMIYVIHAAIQKDSTAEHPVLVLTQAERAQVIGDIEKMFGKKKRAEDNVVVDVCAFALHDFLKNQAWLSADSIQRKKKAAESAENLIEARRLYYQTCDHGEAKACVSAGDLELKLGNSTEAQRLYGIACDATDREGCDALKKFKSSLQTHNPSTLISKAWFFIGPKAMFQNHPNRTSKELTVKTGDAFSLGIQMKSYTERLNTRVKLTVPSAPEKFPCPTCQPGELSISGNTITVEQNSKLKDNVYEFYWSIGEGDPRGNYRMSIVIDDLEVAAYDFVVK